MVSGKSNKLARIVAWAVRPEKETSTTFSWVHFSTVDQAHRHTFSECENL